MAQHINSALANRMPCVLATASPDGEPDVGFKGSMMVFDDEHLAYWERTRGRHLANVERNPKVAVMYQNFAERVGWRFFGEATVFKEGERWREIMGRVIEAELNQDPERLGYAVLVRVDRVVARGQVIMAREEAQTGATAPD
jgi:nitroimidazol reductase NimA-like FMN-containing flavoprotein (pyridoxamine 5'-phosphate oxidase superfamily)